MFPCHRDVNDGADHVRGAEAGTLTASLHEDPLSRACAKSPRRPTEPGSAGPFGGGSGLGLHPAPSGTSAPALGKVSSAPSLRPLVLPALSPLPPAPSRNGPEKRVRDEHVGRGSARGTWQGGLGSLTGGRGGPGAFIESTTSRMNWESKTPMR